MSADLGFIGWLAFLAALVIFVILALASATFDLAHGSLQDWGFALVAFGLAFSGWWDSRSRRPHP